MWIFFFFSFCVLPPPGGGGGITLFQLLFYCIFLPNKREKRLRIMIMEIKQRPEQETGEPWTR